jgi:hypothetical protein
MFSNIIKSTDAGPMNLKVNKTFSNGVKLTWKLDKIQLFEIKYENNKLSTADQVQVIP